MPRRQYSHRRQAEMQEINTRSPGWNAVTAGPVLSTMPTPSWPRMRPGTQVGTSPSRMCRSAPQIVVIATRGHSDPDDRVSRRLDVGDRALLERLLLRSLKDEFIVFLQIVVGRLLTSTG
jgi:hypothetical protein